MDHQNRFDAYVSDIQQALDKYLPEVDVPQKKVQDAMRYSLLTPGKRIRSMLTLEFCRVSGADPSLAMPFACALEMIHCYSLVHDDLPCMDNDDFRRGLPTNHKVYGEDFAVLAGDGLLTHAFDTALKASSDLPAAQVLDGLRTLSEAAGVNGMLGGQAIDVENDGHLANLDALCHMYALKTGALIKAAGRLGCIAAGADEERVKAAELYTASVGLAFQIRDDLLDLEGDEAIGKTTYPRCVGVEEAQRKIDELTVTACRAAEHFDDPSFLVWLAKKLAGRNV